MLNTHLFSKVMALIFVFSLTTTYAQKDYSSLLWKIEGNGLEKPSYLYGTMHVSSKIAFNLGDEFFDALSSVDAIALETNPEVWLDFYRGDEVQRITSIIDNSRTSFSDRGFYNRFSRIPQYDLEGFQEFLAPQDRIVNQLLYRFNYGNEDYEETTYLDMFLFQTARKEGKEVYSLEDFTESFFLARRASLPDEDADDELTFRNNGVSQDELQTAYLERNLNTLDSMITEKFSNNYRKYLLDIRNDNMVVAMDSLMPEKSIFAGVGAAHLAGENGMIEMLRSKGYKVEPVQFNKSSSSNKKFNKIKASSVNVPMENYTSEDGRISLQSIGEFYPENRGLNRNMIQSYFLPDFSNGAYYSYKRMSKLPYGENYREKGGLNYIDSILYLATPGDISKQKNTSISNYEAIEVTSELSRNRYLKQLIIDTPEEIIVFKASGNKSFIKDKNVKNYFNSIKIAEGSQPVDLEKLGISINLPENYVVAENDKSEIYINGETKKGNFFSFRSAYLKDLNELEQDEFELNYLVRSLADELEYEVANSIVDPINKSTHATLTKDDHKYYVYYKIYHNFYYQIIVENDEEDANNLMDSFFKSPPKYTDVEVFSENDTLLDISYTSYHDASLDSLLYKEFKSLREDFERAENREDSLNRSFEGEFNTRLFEDPLTGEVVGLKHSTLNEYYSLEDGLEGVRERILLKYSEDSLYYEPEIISEIKTDTSYQIEYRYAKDGTDRVLHYTDIIIGDVFITISTSYDTTLNQSEFSKQIFESLRSRTKSNEDNFVTRKKGNDWLEDIRSDEYQISEQAKESLGKVIFDETNREDLENLLLNDSLEVIDNELRIQLLSDYTYFFDEDEEYLSFLSKFYDQFKDNADIQVAVLDDISKIGTAESTEKFVSIIVDNPPMTNDDYDLYNLFKAFEDSTHLIRPHLPKLEQFAMDYDEFLPRIVYLVSRANLNGSFSSNELSDEFLEKLEKTAKQNLRKIAFSENNTDDILSDMLDLGVVLLLHEDAEKRFNSITDKLDTISDKRFKANFLSKRINRGLPYTIEEVEEVINDTTYAHVFFDWADYIPGVQDSLFELINPSKELIYHSYALDNGGYRVNKDSLKFHSKISANTYMDSGDVYIYTSASNYGTKSVIAVYFVDPEENYTYDFDLDISTVMYEEGKLEEAIEDLKQEVELSNRVRVNNGYGFF